MAINSPGRTPKLLWLGIVGTCLTLAALPANAANFTGWDFDDGTLQGWTVVNAPTLGLNAYAAYTPASNPTGVAAWDPVGFNSKSPAAGYLAGPFPFADRSLYHDAPLVLRSPTFQIASGGEISALVLGGNPGANAVPPSNFSDLSGEAINTAEEAPNDTSYFGIALRRDSDGAYLLHKARSAAQSGGTSWQQLRFTEAELAPIIAQNPGSQFTIDLIDTGFGTFGNVALDTVTIPVPSGNSLMSGGGQWNILKRDSALVATQGDGAGGLAAADAVLALPSGNPSITAEFTGTAPVINIDGAPLTSTVGLRGHFANNTPYLGGSMDRFVMKVTGKINVLEAGDITFGFVANDGARLKINGILVAQDDYGADIACDTLGTINLAAGLHDVEFVMFESTGADTWELFVATTLGTFTSINQASFELLQAFNVGVPGDFDGDGDVDGADFVVWQTNYPTANGASLANGDADSDGDVDGADFDAWQSSFPQNGGGASPVPEPSTYLTLLIGAVMALAWKRTPGQCAK